LIVCPGYASLHPGYSAVIPGRHEVANPESILRSTGDMGIPGPVLRTVPE